MSSRQNKIDTELRASACPRCGKVEVLQPIIYGLPNEDFDFENNISGGCLVGGYMPNIGCIECGWKGLKNPYTGEIVDKNAVDLEEDQPGGLDQRDPALFPTIILTGVAVAPVIPAPVGTEVAERDTGPRLDGRQLQVAEKLELDPVASLFLHPGKILPLTLNVTLDSTVVFAVITTAARKVAVVADPASASELKDEVS